jgi:hypothetical protein
MSDGGGGRGSAANGAAVKETTRTWSPNGDGTGRSADQSDLLSGSTGSASPADKATRTAYERGRRLLSPATVKASRSPQIAVDRPIVAGAQQVSSAPGPVSMNQIEQVRDRFVAVPGLAALQSALRERSLVVLVAAERSGRSTTGLWLLDERTDGAVSRLDPTANPPFPAADQIVEGHGYLASIDRTTVPNRVVADRLAADLAAKGAYCVITAHPTSALRRELGFYCVEHVQADPVAILGRHLQAGVGAVDGDELGARVEELASSPVTARLLGPAARPFEAAEAAALLLAHGRGERSRDETDTLIERLVVDDRIEEWFSVLVGITHGQHADRARRLTAMRIAVAVFDGLPRHIAETTAERLAIRMAVPPAPPGDAFGSDRFVLPRTGPRGVDPDETATLLATTPITVARGEVPVFARTVPGETISYRDDRLPSAVLRCVWHNHYPLRAPMLGWLADLSRDERQQVRFRAAQAAGLLCALDYTHTLDALVLPAAIAGSDAADGEVPTDVSWRRQFAAMAIDHVARDERLRRFVRFQVRRWRRAADPALRWTAAYAYGFDIGARDPEHTFEELRVLGTPWESRPYATMTHTQKRDEESVFHAAGAAIAGMFCAGAHIEVLAKLHDWIVDPRSSVRLLAAQAVIYLTTEMAFRIGTPEATGDGGGPEAVPLLDETDREQRAIWPVLVALHGRHPELQRQGAELIRFALRSNAQTVALTAFGDIFDIAEDYPDTALPAVEAFLPLVIKDEADRGRLLDLLHRMRHAWADALSPEVADRLEGVITGIPVVTGRKVFS